VAYVVFLACCLIWGSTFLAIRIGNEAVPPVWAATLRLLLAAPLLTGLAIATRQRFPRGPALRAALLFGIFNFGINLSLPYWGERVVPSGIAAVLYATVPLSTALLAAALGVERLAPRKLGAAALAIVGVAVIFLGELRFDVPLTGLIAVFFAATAGALSSVFLKQAPQPSAITANAVGAAIGAAVCAAVSLALGEDHALPATSAGWWPIAYLTIAGSLGAYVLYTWLVQDWPVTNATWSASSSRSSPSSWALWLKANSALGVVSRCGGGAHRSRHRAATVVWPHSSDRLGSREVGGSPIRSAPQHPGARPSNLSSMGCEGCPAL